MLYFVLRGIDRRVISQLLTAQHGNLLAAAAVLIVSQIILGGLRWGTVLSAMCKTRPPTLLSLLAIFYASTFFNALPIGTVGGDIARVWLARRFSAFSTADRPIGLTRSVLVIGALIILAVVTLPTVAHPLAATASFAGVVILLAAAAGFLLLQPIERIVGRWRDVWLMSSVLRTSEELRLTMQRGGLLALLCALLAAACGALAAYCIARSLGIDVGLMAMIAIMSLSLSPPRCQFHLPAGASARCRWWRCSVYWALIVKRLSPLG